MPTLAPTPTQTVIRHGERNVHCQSYNHCLDVANRGAWRGFTCEKCPLKAQAKAPRADTFLRQQKDATLG